MRPRGVGSLAADGKFAFEVAVERHTIGQQVMNACSGFAGQPERDVFIDNAAADRDRVDGMGFGAVAFRHSRGDAALRPCA